jgi:hypothetical protein
VLHCSDLHFISHVRCAITEEEAERIANSIRAGRNDDDADDADDDGITDDDDIAAATRQDKSSNGAARVSQTEAGHHSSSRRRNQHGAHEHTSCQRNMPSFPPCSWVVIVSSSIQVGGAAPAYLV